MPFKDREKLLAWRATPEFKKRNYEKVKAWRGKSGSKEKRAEEARRWRARHPEVIQAIKLRFRAKHLERVREEDKLAKRIYRETDQYKAAQAARSAAYKARKRAREEQIAGRPCPALCELCGENNIRIVFDHCHAHGHFRGWICDRCNRVLGLMKDDAGLLRKMADYLEDRNGNQHERTGEAFKA